MKQNVLNYIIQSNDNKKIEGHEDNKFEVSDRIF